MVGSEKRDKGFKNDLCLVHKLLLQVQVFEFIVSKNLKTLQDNTTKEETQKPR